MVIPGWVTVTYSVVFESPDPGSTVTVPPAPAAVQASESVWKWLPSNGVAVGTTNTLAGRARGSRHSRDKRARDRTNERFRDDFQSRQFQRVMVVPRGRKANGAV